MDGPERSVRSTWDRAWLSLGLATLLIAGVALGLARFVIERGGNLAWDDADYLRRGLRLARLAQSDLILAGSEWLRERPRPPWLMAWIGASALVVGRARLDAVLIASAVLPYVGLHVAVARQSARLSSPWAAPLAVLVLASSPMGLAFGAKVMVETFLGLWVLLAIATASRFLVRPTPWLGAAFGASLGLAALTKLTVALLLPVPILAVLWRLVRSGARQRWILGLAVLLPAVLIAAPWYSQNGEAAIEFALWSSRYNQVAEARIDSEPVRQRLTALADRIVGPAALALIPAAIGACLLNRCSRGVVEPTSHPHERAAFERLTLAAAGLATLALLVPSYFDPRFLLPIGPGLAVVLAGRLGELASRQRLAVPGLLTVLALGVSGGVGELRRQPTTTTYWAAQELLDQLSARYGIQRLANIGDSPDWNVCKTALLNELRRDPDACSVLHDLSRIDPADLDRFLSRLDALIVLDPEAIPAPLAEQSPGLNRTLGGLDRRSLEARFERVEPGLAARELPPMSVFVRRR